MPLFIPLSICGVVELVGSDVGFTDLGRSMEFAVGKLDEEDTVEEVVVDRNTVDRLTGAGAEKLSFVGLLQSDFPSFIPQHLQTWAL